MKGFWNRNKVVILYCIFGTLTTLVDWIIFYFIKATGFTKTNYGFMLANAISFTSSVLFAYVTNKRYVFEGSEKRPLMVLKEAAIFFAGRMLSGLFEIFGPAPLSHYLGKGFKIPLWGGNVFHFDAQWMAKLIMSCFVVFINYFYGKWFVFKNHKREKLMEKAPDNFD